MNGMPTRPQRSAGGYDPVVGRMLSPENNLQAPDYSQNHNRYSYALNNPLKFTDPTGNEYDDFNPIDDIKDFFNGIGNLLRGEKWNAKYKCTPKVKVETEVREVTLKPATIIADKRDETPMEQSTKPDYTPKIIPIHHNEQHNFAQWRHVEKVQFEFNNIKSDEGDQLGITRSRLIGNNQRELFNERFQRNQTKFFNSNRFFAPVKKDVFSINFDRNLVFQPQYDNIQNISDDGTVSDSNTFADFSVQNYYRNYKIVLKMRGTAKYFEALRKSGKIY